MIAHCNEPSGIQQDPVKRRRLEKWTLKVKRGRDGQDGKDAEIPRVVARGQAVTMAALVTLEHAKQHLRVTTIDRDTDLQIKAEQASAIILDYLKGRANIEATITDLDGRRGQCAHDGAAHGFISGNTADIAGHVVSRTRS